MGLMSFFSRKKAADGQHSIPQVKSQRYDAAPISSPPIRGTYPVAGNGPSVMSSLARSTKFKDGQYTIPAHALPESHSPPSALSYLRDGSDIDRPHSAPNAPRRPGKSSHKKDALDAWPLPQPRAPFSPLGHRRSDSLMSTDSSGRGFVDLLDAQSGIKHTDFRSRVQAAGARVYGEDVADRNIAAAYAKVDVNGKVKLGQSARSKVYDDEDRYRARVRRVNEDGGLYHRISKQISVEAELGRSETEKANVAARRKTLGSILPGSDTTTTTRPRPKSFSRPTGSQINDLTVPRTSDVPVLPAGIENRATEASANKRYSVYAAPGVQPVHDLTLFHQPMPMDTGDAPYQDQHYRGSVSNPAPATSRKRSRRKTFHASMPLSFASFASKKTCDADTKSSGPRPAGQHAGTEGPAPSPFVRQSPSHSSIKGANNNNNNNKTNLYVRSLSLMSSPAPKIPHDTFAPEDRGVPPSNGFRGTSAITKSIRHWSMASSTPTTAASSTTSSNPFPGRPHSQHTANTSVDLSSTSGASGKRAFSPATVQPSDSCTSLHSGNTAQTYLTALEGPMDIILTSLNSPTSRNHPLRSHPIIPSKSVHQPRANTMHTLTPIVPLPVPDDYPATPSPSEPSPTQARGEAEHDLLFCDVGYGLCGDDQLPGLGGSTGEAFVPRFRTRSPSLPNLGGRGKGYVLDTPLDYESDDDAEAPAGEGWKVDDYTSTSDDDEHSGSDSDLSEEDEGEPLPEHLLRRLEQTTAPQHQIAATQPRSLRRKESFSLGDCYEDVGYDTKVQFEPRQFDQKVMDKRKSVVEAGGSGAARVTKRRSFPLRPGAGASYA